MKFSYSNRNWALAAHLVAMVSVAGGLTSQVAAQNATPAVCPPRIAAASGDEDCRRIVSDALFADPYFYDAHVTVSVKKGVILLQGFVFSDWDLRDAIRIASAAAGDRRVVDELTIEVGGRR